MASIAANIIDLPRNVQSENDGVSAKVKKAKKRIRVKEYLSDHEVAQLMESAKHGRHGVRDQLLILLAWRHGLRCEELTSMKLVQINIEGREIYVIRVKGSHSNHHPLSEDEIRFIKRWLKKREGYKGSGSDCLFLNERGEGMQPHAFNYLLNTIAKRAGFMFKVYPHMLRHSCGAHIANNGKNAFDIAGYLGHKNIQNSMRYVHVSATRFKDIW